ncbi:hypothetical protein HGM15179_018611, partial [Zosterops borbonicus]
FLSLLQSPITDALCERRRTGYLTAIGDAPGTDRDGERTAFGPTIPVCCDVT